MKKIILFTLAIVFTSAAVAQTTLVKGPVFSFDEKSFDFGDVKQGEKVTYTFKYKNTGTDTLKISNVVSSCGCTVPHSYEKIIPPGASASITVQFDSAGKMGVVNKTLTILSNAVSSNGDPAEYLRIRVNVIP